MTERAPLTHILIEGRPLCGKPGVPGEWSDGDRWCRWAERCEATCDECLVAAFRRQAQSDPLVPPDAGTPVRAALLPPERERELLEAVFAWRAQGTLQRWKTEPSRTLAKLVTTIGRELPPDVRTRLEEQARDRVAEDALTRRYAIQASKGRARELQALFENLAEISERLALVVEEEHFAADEQLAKLQPPTPICGCGKPGRPSDVSANTFTCDACGAVWQRRLKGGA
jgi:hypothetical protein